MSVTVRRRKRALTTARIGPSPSPNDELTLPQSLDDFSCDMSESLEV